MNNCFNIINLIVNIFVVIGTMSASMISLYISKNSNRPNIKINYRISRHNDISSYLELTFFNNSLVLANINAIFYKRIYIDTIYLFPCGNTYVKSGESMPIKLPFKKENEYDLIVKRKFYLTIICNGFKYKIKIKNSNKYKNNKGSIKK